MTRPRRSDSHLEGDEPLLGRLRRLSLHGLAARWHEIKDQPWVAELCTYEESARQKRSFERRLAHAHIGAFKPAADFDWAWPKKIDREAIDELLSLAFLDEGVNAVFLGPNGVGKTMLLRNIAHRAVLAGHTVRFTTASDMLSDLAAQESSVALKRRLGRYCKPKLLCVDEVGYLSYDARYADLFFEVVTRRYDGPRSIVLSTNKPFAEWPSVFPNAACVVTLVDRLLHRAELVAIEGSSYRLKEATERAASKAKTRTSRRKA